MLLLCYISEANPAFLSLLTDTAAGYFLENIFAYKVYDQLVLYSTLL